MAIKLALKTVRDLQTLTHNMEQFKGAAPEYGPKEKGCQTLTNERFGRRAFDIGQLHGP
jgi:hypothetical protein